MVPENSFKSLVKSFSKAEILVFCSMIVAGIAGIALPALHYYQSFFS